VQAELLLAAHMPETRSGDDIRKLRASLKALLRRLGWPHAHGREQSNYQRTPNKSCTRRRKA